MCEVLWGWSVPYQWATKGEQCHFLKTKCHVGLVVIWECQWVELKKTDPDVMTFLKIRHHLPQAHPHSTSMLGTKPTTEKFITKAIVDESLFSMALVDIHVPELLKEKFHDMPPIFKTATVGREDMKSYCEHISWSHIVNRKVCWKLLGGCSFPVIIVEWEGRYCFQDWMNEVANVRRAAQQESSKAIGGGSTKTLTNNA